jgi:hypothetical protein
VKKIGVLYICTGKYSIFWKDFFESAEKFLLFNSDKHYFVFTDAKYLYMESNCSRIHKVYQKSLGWPDNTLKRFHIFLKRECELKNYDFLFFFNANCLFIKPIEEEEFLPQTDLLVVQHPGFYDKTNSIFTYDRNPKSMAYIEKGKGLYYVCGGVNGGKTKCFLSLMHDLKKNIDIDTKNNTIALWHDESHINKYIIGKNNYTLLTPSYCYPEGWHLPFDAKIIIRDKSKYMNVELLKTNVLVFYMQHIKMAIKAYLKFIIKIVTCVGSCKKTNHNCSIDS